MDNLFVLHSVINAVFNKGGKTYFTFTYFRKAFDYLDKDVMWYKLIEKRIRCKMVDIIRSMYCETSSRVR